MHLRRLPGRCSLLACVGADLPGGELTPRLWHGACIRYTERCLFSYRAAVRTAPTGSHIARVVVSRAVRVRWAASRPTRPASAPSFWPWWRWAVSPPRRSSVTSPRTCRPRTTSPRCRSRCRRTSTTAPASTCSTRSRRSGASLSRSTPSPRRCRPRRCRSRTRRSGRTRASTSAASSARSTPIRPPAASRRVARPSRSS